MCGKLGKVHLTIVMALTMLHRIHFFYQFRLIVLTCAMNPVIGVSTEGLFPCVTRSVHFLGWVPPLCTYLNAANHQLRVAHQLNSIC